jgi:hypothetical protein
MDFFAAVCGDCGRVPLVISFAANIGFCDDQAALGQFPQKILKADFFIKKTGDFSLYDLLNFHDLSFPPEWR